MAHLHDVGTSGGTGPAKFLFDLIGWSRLMSGVVGTSFCVFGGLVAVAPGLASDGTAFILKLLMGIVLFVVGILIARAGKLGPACELHFDPVRAEFFLLYEDEKLEEEHNVMPSRNVEVNVSGRHFSVASSGQGTQVNVALESADLAEQVSESYRAATRVA